MSPLYATTNRSNSSHQRTISHSRGFSLLEILIAVAVLAGVATIGVMAMSGVSEGSKRAKLESDIATLNGAVKAYVSSGGDLSGSATPNDVLAKMKTVLTAAQAKTQINPLTGSMIDRRLVAEMQTVSEAATGEPRVYWNSADENFTIGTSGGVGVKRFHLDENLANAAIQTESRDGGAMEFASSSGWVWDDGGQWATDSSPVPTNVGTNPFPDAPPPASATAGTATAGTATAGTATAGTATGGDDGTPELPRLPTPTVDIGGGTYPPTDFPMLVTATNAGVYGSDGTLKYRINYGSWMLYSGPVSVPQDSSLHLLAFSNDLTAYQNSYQRSGYYYQQQPPRLPTPVLNKSGGAYLTTEYPLTVLVANVSTYGTNGDLKYNINSGAWTPYVAGITVQPDQTLRVMAFSTDAAAYRDSYQRSEYYYSVASSFSGSTTGTWKEVGGGNNLLFSLTEEDTFLSHGTPEIDLGDGTIVTAGEANTMKFLSTNFSEILPGQQFTLAEILYHNGTTFDSSHADRTKLKMDIAFTNPAVTERINIQLELINTENSSDPDDSADYVKFKNVNQVHQIDVGGTIYDLDLQFGTTDVNGFASAKEFHVYEGATARGELRATIAIAP